MKFETGVQVKDYWANLASPAPQILIENGSVSDVFLVHTSLLSNIVVFDVVFT
jgi:hypothetical protein